MRLLGRRNGGRKENVSRPRPQNLFTRVAKRLFRRTIELGNDAFVVDRNDRVQRRLEDGVFAGLRFF